MRRYCILALALVVASALLPSVARSDPKTDSKIAPLEAGANTVFVLPWGLYFHRSDHLRMSDAEAITPEEADRRGYLPCPDCLPPLTSRAASEETASGHRKITDYYKALLEEREHPTTNQLPVGELPRAGAAGGMGGAPRAAGGGGPAGAAGAGAPAAAPAAPAYGAPAGAP